MKAWNVVQILLAITLPSAIAIAQPRPPDSLWSRTYGGAGEDACWSVQQTSDGGYILAGNTESFGASGRNFWLLKTDANGDSVWSNTFGGNREEFCRSASQTSDGGYILAGLTYVSAWLVKTDVDGNVVWDCTYPYSSLSEFSCVRQTQEGGYIAAGWSLYYGDMDYDAFLVKTDANGAQLWLRSFGGDEDDGFNSVQQTSDGGYILVYCLTLFATYRGQL
ncbi:MAG: hypothetical protein V1784_11615 [bacterium]